VAFLVFGDREFTDRFLKAGLPVVGVAHDTASALNHLKSSTAEDVVVGFPGFEGEEFAFHAAELYRDRRFYLACDRPTADLWARAAALGVRLVARKTAAEDVRQAALAPRGSLTNRESVDPEVLREADAEYQAAKAVALRTLKHQRACVYCPSGGKGKTAIAASLAAVAASWTKKKGLEYKVCVVEGAPPTQQQSIWDWLQVPESVPVDITVWERVEGLPGWDAVERLLVNVGGVSRVPELANLYFLPPPRNLTEVVSGEAMLRILGILDQYFDLMVVDLPPDLRYNAALVAVQTSPLVLLVVTPEKPVVKQCQNVVAQAPRLQINLSALRIVLNCPHSPAAVSLDPRKYSEALGGIPAIGPVIPHDPELVALLNKGGLPPVLSKPDGPFGRALWQLAGAVLGHEIFQEAKKRRGLLSRFFERRLAL
jgi:pilus assembly protein CpaE